MDWHKPIHFISFPILVRLAGIEPTTPWFVAKYSIQLSYSRATTKNWRRLRESNPRYRFKPICFLSREVPSTTRPSLHILARIITRRDKGKNHIFPDVIGQEIYP